MPNTLSINIPGPIRTLSPNDTYPTHEANNGLGGWHTVDSSVNLNDIPNDRRTVGMTVFSIKDGISFVLLKDTSNREVWIPYSEVILNTKNDLLTLNDIDSLFQ